MSYRDDDVARVDRANALIGEIAELERQKVAQATVEEKIEAARRELATLQITPAPPVVQPSHGVVAHLLVFGATAAAAFVGYTMFV